MSCSKLAKLYSDKPLNMSIPKLQLSYISSTHRSSQRVNDLPDDVIIFVLQHFSLQPCIAHFRCVCSRWNTIVLSISDRKGSLKIFSNEFHWKTYGYAVKTFNNPESGELALKPWGSDDALEMTC